MEKSFLVQVIGRLSGDKQDVRELRVLNRVLSWKSGGVSSLKQTRATKRF